MRTELDMWLSVFWQDHTARQYCLRLRSPRDLLWPMIEPRSRTQLQRSAMAAGVLCFSAWLAPVFAGNGESTAPPPALVSPAAPAPAAPAITWDQAANIRDAAERIAKVQRRGGAEAAMKHIDACYRTHSLASAYSAPFEACIAQDYLETRLLVKVYARLPAEVTKKLGAPTADNLAQAMGRRVTSAFRQYSVPVAEAEKFKALVDQHGTPVFLKIVFPDAAGEIDKREKSKSESNSEPTTEPNSEPSGQSGSEKN